MKKVNFKYQHQLQVFLENNRDVVLVSDFFGCTCYYDQEFKAPTYRSFDFLSDGLIIELSDIRLWEGLSTKEERTFLLAEPIHDVKFSQLHELYMFLSANPKHCVHVKLNEHQTVSLHFNKNGFSVHHPIGEEVSITEVEDALDFKKPFPIIKKKKVGIK